MTPEGLTDSWLSSVLRSDVSVRGTSRIGDGLVGMNIRLELDSDGSLPATLVAKLPSPDPTSRATGIALRNYEREVSFYLEIAPTVDIRVPRCYHGEWHADSGDFVLLMEDLAPAVQGNQITGCRSPARPAPRSTSWPGCTAHDGATRRSTTSSGSAGGRRLIRPQLAMLWSMFLPGFMATFGKYLSTDAAAVIERFGQRIGALGRRSRPAEHRHPRRLPARQPDVRRSRWWRRYRNRRLADAGSRARNHRRQLLPRRRRLARGTAPHRARVGRRVRQGTRRVRRRGRSRTNCGSSTDAMRMPAS